MTTTNCETNSHPLWNFFFKIFFFVSKRRKKLKPSGPHTLTCKNFLDGVCKLFLQLSRQKCVHCFIATYMPTLSYVGEACSLPQAVTSHGLSSLASFLKNLSSKRVCCVFRDIRDKNAVNQGFWSKTAVFSLPATKVHCFLIFWLPHLYNLLQPGIRKQQKYTSIHEYLYLAINKAKFALLLFQPSHCSRVI